MDNSIRHSTKQLFVPLPPPERELAVKELLEDIQQISELESKIDGYKDAIKLINSNIDVAQEHLTDTSRKIKHGTLAAVPVKIVLDWNNRRVTTFRLDTYDIIEDREMNENDQPLVTDEVEETPGTVRQVKQIGYVDEEKSTKQIEHKEE